MCTVPCDANSSDKANLLGTLIGYNLPSKIKSSGNQMLVTFVSDHFGTDPGFLANTHEEPKPAADPKARDCSIANPCDRDGSRNFLSRFLGRDETRNAVSTRLVPKN